jgi:TolB-like protein
MNLRDVLSELRRRRVFKVTAIYAIVAWIVVQVAATTFPVLMLPEWTVRLVIALVLLGLPVVALLAWIFDITPEGIERTRRTPADEAEPSATVAAGPARGPRRLPAWALAVLLVAALGMGVYRYGPLERVRPDSPAADLAPAEKLDRSIAVLPFADFSPGGGQEWFSDGLTEEILNALTRLPDLRVAARAGSFRFKGSREDVREIASTLGVAHILEGSMRHTGDRVRITAQLTRAEDGVRLWSQNFDRDAADVIRIQEEIAFEIARTMQTALEPEALERLVAAGTNSVAASSLTWKRRKSFRRLAALMVAVGLEPTTSRM